MPPRSEYSKGTEALRRKAYYGAGVVMSLGQDTGDVAFQVREEIIPGAARLRTAGRGITMPEPGRTEAPYWVTSEAEGRKAVQEQAARKVDLIKIWVDDRDGMFKKLTPAQKALLLSASSFALLSGTNSNPKLVIP